MGDIKLSKYSVDYITAQLLVSMKDKMTKGIRISLHPFLQISRPCEISMADRVIHMTEMEKHLRIPAVDACCSVNEHS